MFDCRVSVNRLARAATLSLRAAVVSLLLAGAASIAIAQESRATAEGAAQTLSAASAVSNSADQDTSAPLKIRAQSELKYISDPQPLIMASPFPHNIPVDLATSLASSTRLWTLKRSFLIPHATTLLQAARLSFAAALALG